MNPVTPALARFADAHPSVRRMLSPALAVRRRFIQRAADRQQAILDRMSTLFVEDPCLRIDEFDGEFYLDSRSSLFHRVVLAGHYEPELTRRCVELLDPDRDVLDIGANIGFHAVLFARRLRTGTVLSVEPTPRALNRLRRNLERNGVSVRVSIFEGVASSEPGEVQIHTIAGREEYSSLGAMSHPSISGATTETLTVSATTVDDLVAQRSLRPGFMKIDVEGAEHLVIAGAGQVLAEHRPIILAELSDPLLKANGSSSAEVIHAIERFGYRVSDPLRPDVAPGQRSFGDILCVPDRG